jgi:hypothetical protein
MHKRSERSAERVAGDPAPLQRLVGFTPPPRHWCVGDSASERGTTSLTKAEVASGHNRSAGTSVSRFNPSTPADTKYKAGGGLEADGKLAAAESTNRQGADVRHTRAAVAPGVLARRSTDLAEVAHRYHQRVPSWKQE